MIQIIHAPLTIGPGSISVAITLAAAADRLTPMLGATGTSIIVRVSGCQLFCIGIRIFWMGSQEPLRSLMHS